MRHDALPISCLTYEVVVNAFRPYQDMTPATCKDGSIDFWHHRRSVHNIQSIVKTINAVFDLNIFLDIAKANPEFRPKPIGKGLIYFNKDEHAKLTDIKIERSTFRLFEACPGRRAFGEPESDSDDSVHEEERVYRPSGPTTGLNVPWISNIGADGNPSAICSVHW